MDKEIVSTCSAVHAFDCRCPPGTAIKEYVREYGTYWISDDPELMEEVRKYFNDTKR